jgi:hypothetical protein
LRRDDEHVRHAARLHLTRSIVPRSTAVSGNCGFSARRPTRDSARLGAGPLLALRTDVLAGVETALAFLILLGVVLRPLVLDKQA